MWTTKKLKNEEQRHMSGKRSNQQKHVEKGRKMRKYEENAILKKGPHKKKERNTNGEYFKKKSKMKNKEEKRKNKEEKRKNKENKGRTKKTKDRTWWTINKRKKEERERTKGEEKGSHREKYPTKQRTKTMEREHV